MNFNVGDVLLWKNFPLKKDEKSPIKDRLFVFLGKTSYGNIPVFFFMITTTTQTEHFDAGGDRASHCFFRISAGKGNLDEESIIDFDYDLYTDITETAIEKYSDDISVIGNLDNETKRNIYNKLITSKRISPKIIKDIHSSYNLAEVTGLKKS